MLNLLLLPLYIVLVVAAPLILWGLLRRPHLTLVCSGVLYFASRHFGWNLPSFPDGHWYFNPFAWQFLFVFGIWCGFGNGPKIRGWVTSWPNQALCWTIVVLALVIVISWNVEPLYGLVPEEIGKLLYPIDKTTLAPARLLHFLALLGIVAMLLVMVALVALVNIVLAHAPQVSGAPVTVERVFGWLFAPLVWLYGVPWNEAAEAGALLGQVHDRGHRDGHERMFFSFSTSPSPRRQAAPPSGASQDRVEPAYLEAVRNRQQWPLEDVLPFHQ